MNRNIHRRDFLKIAGISGAATTVFAHHPHLAHAASDDVIAEGPLVREVLPKLEKGAIHNIRPAIREEILDNPHAVFIIRTSVKAEKDARGSFDSIGKQLEEAGFDTARKLFSRGTEQGGQTSLNPNWTYIPPKLRFPTIGITTAPQFVAGFGDALKEMGNTNIVVSERSAGANFLKEAGHVGIIEDHGLLFIDGNYKKFEQYEKGELNWFEFDGVVWRRVPVFRPHFDKNTFTVNMPTLKNHNLGLTTLSIKNMQGFIPTGYGHYCDQWHQVYPMRKEMQKDINPDFWENVEKSFLKHANMDYTDWDIWNSYPLYQERGGWKEFSKVRKNREKADEFMKGIRNLMWDEQWGQRTVDTLEALKPDINIIEGVIGRDGDAFGNGTDYLTNYIIAGLDLVATDAVASYLMGQDPRELYYLRMADERGYGPIDPEHIPVFIIKDGTVERLHDVTSLKRYRLGFYLHTRLDDGLRFF